MRTYEFVYIVDPRVPDEEVSKLYGEYRSLITVEDVDITHEQDWGRRKLAYPIKKLTEGRYFFLRLQTPGRNPLPDVEYRMRQNEQVLRYLSVRTDLENLPPPPDKSDEPAGEAESTEEEAP